MTFIRKYSDEIKFETESKTNTVNLQYSPQYMESRFDLRPMAFFFLLVTGFSKPRFFQCTQLLSTAINVF